jgi:cytochrome c553
MTWLRLLLLPVVALLPSLVCAAEKDGPTIYREMCASCHGDKGQGSKDYPEPLIGDRSLGQLSHYIDKQMPEGEPEKLDAAGSATVAKYIHETFYSPVAQARNKPARIDLSRLTVKQYQNTVTDLVASFRQPGSGLGEQGLKAEYYKGRRHDNKNKALDRVDATVDFTYDNKTPDEKIEGPEFAVRWEGSVFAPETGDYEFVVQTEHSCRLWVNQSFFNGPPPIIDQGVKSGNDTEYRATVTLLGGRAYPLKLEYTKGKAGVGDPKLNKDVDKLGKSSIHLLWVPPRRSLEVIPARCLTTAKNPELYVVKTPFPPDDRSIGYERANTISKAWDNSTTDGALEASNYVIERFKSLSGEVPLDTKEEVKVKEFCYKFVERSFRRPLTPEQKTYFVDRHFTESPDRTNAVKRVVLLALKSPRFLYREVGTEKPDQYDVAARLSFGLWDSIPDQKLLKAAAEKKLETRDQLVAEATRMQTDLRARDKLRGFMLQWLRIDQPIDMAKDEKLFPEFKPETISDLRTSLELSLQDFLTSKEPDFRKFLLDEELYLNGRLAKLYGADLPEDAAFQKVKLDADKRAGILTHPYILSVFAYNGTSSPIHRGVFLARSMLGRVIKPPQEAFTPIAPDLHPSLNTRERISLQTKAEACQLCHNMINPLGFSLENFDAIGKFREQEKKRPVDSQGSYVSRDDKTVKFRGARELGKFLADSPEVSAALTQQLFQFEIKQPIRAYGSDRLEKLREDYVKNGYNFQRLAREIVVTAALPRPLAGE